MSFIRYQIDFQKKRKYFYNFLLMGSIVDILIIASVAYFYKLSFSLSLKVFLGVVLLTFIIYILPLLLLYKNYLKYTGDSKLKISDDYQNPSFEFDFKWNTFFFKIEDISNIEVHMSYTMFEKRMRWFFWDELFYYVVFLKNGNSFIISCLICDDLLKYFPNVKVQRKKRLFPIILTPASARL
ncbi:MAG: hypothetical protein AAFZ89_01700 [Bacteroidota bacterium]